MPGRGNGKCLFLKGASLKEFRFISTEKVCFHAKGSFLPRRSGGGIFLGRRYISTAEVYFFGGGTFLRRRHISTAEAHFYGGGIFLRRGCISTAEVYLYEESVFL